MDKLWFFVSLLVEGASSVFLGLGVLSFSNKEFLFM